jgi:vanillate O-demethylase ferredoxin subunit
MAERVEWGEGVIRATRDLSPDIRLIEIAPASAFGSPASGSHINVGVLIGGRSQVRCYSIIGPCADGVYRIAVKRLKESRGGSAYLWTLQAGARLSISAPVNHFELGLGKPDYLLLAGGIGITPIFSHALALKRANARFRLLYACRGRHDAALATELEQEIGDSLHVVIAGEGARVNIPLEINKLDPLGECYVCGPIGMLEDAKKAWSDSGRPIDRLRFETFGNSGRRPAVCFTAHIPRLGKSIAVGVNQTLLEALEAANVDMMFDCRRGECGLCALPVLALEGEIDHRDVFFSAAEKADNAKLCTCVSRVYGPSITLDTADR